MMRKMADSMHLLEIQIFKLVPFFNAVVLYFGFVRNPHGELSTTILKCLPIVCLMLFILLEGFSLSKYYRYSQLILLGLVFSCAGDALLNIDLFPHGMGAFALAQICYISAFGWRPRKWIIAIPLYLMGVTVISIVFKDLEGVLVFGLPIYVLLLLTMCWRAVARGIHHGDFLHVFCTVGSFLFVISDGLIAVNMFITSVPYARILIMSTYYMAQLSIALSTSSECESSKNNKKAKQTPVERANDRTKWRAENKD